MQPSLALLWPEAPPSQRHMRTHLGLSPRGEGLLEERVEDHKDKEVTGGVPSSSMANIHLPSTCIHRDLKTIRAERGYLVQSPIVQEKKLRPETGEGTCSGLLIPAIIIADVHGGLPVAKVLACALNPNVLSEATQKGDKIDSTIIPILWMGKPGLREELTGPNPGRLEVAKSGFEPKAVCCLLTLLAIVVAGPLLDLSPHLHL